MSVHRCLFRHVTLGLAGALIVTMSSGLIAGSPQALAVAHPTHDDVVTADPANNTPNVLDGHVNAFAQVGNTMIVGGKFAKVESGSTVYNRSNIFAFDVATGQISTTFRPVMHGEVYDLQLTPSKSYVVAVGGFTSSAPPRSTARVARYASPTAPSSVAFKPPTFDEVVRDIAFAHGRYYVTGDFTRADNVSRSGVASLAPSAT